MFIRMDFELADLSERELLGIEHLGIAAFRGRHFLIGSRALLDKLGDTHGLSRFAQVAFKRIAQRYATFAAVRPVGDALVVRRDVNEEERHGREIVLPLSRFAEHIWTEQVEILCEDLSDARLYYELAQRALQYSPYRGLHLSLRPCGGGGTNIWDELEQRKSDGRLAVCVVDSDRWHETDSLGDVARRCLAVVRNVLFRIQVFILPARMIENAFPTAWIATTQTGRQFPDRVRMLEELEMNGLTTMRRFANLKEPVAVCKLARAKPKSNRLLADAAEMGVEERAYTPCENAECAKCHVLGGLGTSLPDQVLHCLPKMDKETIKGGLLSDQLSDILSGISNVGLAASPVRV